MTPPLDPEFLKVAIAFLQDYPDLEVALQGDHVITKDLRATLFQYGFLSELQVQLAFDVHSEGVEKKLRDDSLTEVLTSGRRKITGVVISTKQQNSKYGMVHKMLIEEEDGNRVYGTVPARLRGRVRAEDTIRFDAEVHPSDDDPHFGFFKRPTNAERLSKGPSQHQDQTL